uniref:AsIV-cont00010-ORF3 n=1 Tax=Apophua simplicipes ichnovirus TaxID=1329648 RepID=S5DYQ9_9VIRU|nr:AsIV-cont00010-ORF3 [Apophua simplicipes ichnovirus]
MENMTKHEIEKKRPCSIIIEVDEVVKLVETPEDFQKLLEDPVVSKIVCEKLGNKNAKATPWGTKCRKFTKIVGSSLNFWRMMAITFLVADITLYALSMRTDWWEQKDFYAPDLQIKTEY